MVLVVQGRPVVLAAEAPPGQKAPSATAKNLDASV